ncbi:MAG: TetR/AcrR family transcriptional regulator [Kibdelosporangium sp.]
MSVTTDRGRKSKTGRTQEERSAAMRERLLDATIDCLVEHGYSGTTTTRVAERAGVTRGAQVHHFPTKQDLVTAAVRHLAVRRAEQAFAEMDRLSASSDPVGDTLDLLWEIHQGPIFAASMELLLAARTDQSLREQVSDVEPQISDMVVEFGRRIFGEKAESTQLRHYSYTAMDTVRGLLISNWAYPDDSQLDARWQRAKASLRLTAPATLTQT